MITVLFRRKEAGLGIFHAYFPSPETATVVSQFSPCTLLTHVHAFYDTLKGWFFPPLVDNPRSPVFRHFFLETGSLHKASWHRGEAGFNQGLTCTRDVYSAEYRQGA